MNTRTTPQRRFLIVRHRSYRRFFFEVILRWLRTNLSELEPWFEVRQLPLRVRDWSRYCLHVAWLQDPVQRWSPKTYERALTLADQCHEQGLPVVNRVDRLINATKSRGAQLMSAAGIRVPRMSLIQNPREFVATLNGLNLPLFIREDWGHERKMFRVDSSDDLSHIPWENFARPVAVEFVEVRDPHDGLYRKYRYFVAGNLGISHHLHISSDWVTRGENRLLNQQSQAEELRYISQPDKNHELLQRARRALGLDLAAFDYGYTPDGQMIVWEANPFPHFLFATKRLKYKNPAMHRTLLALVHLYFSAAGLPIPSVIEDSLQLDLPALERRFQIVRKTNLMDRLLVWPRCFPSWPT
jgi:hypothetical protein